MKKCLFNPKGVLLLLMLCVSVLTSMAQKVTLSFRQAPLESVLASIKQQTGYALIFSEQVVNVEQPVSIEVQNEELEPVLDKLFGGTGIVYEVKEQKLYLYKAEGPIKATQEPQTKEVSGVVTDAHDVPIIGATVKVKENPSIGTVTNYDGEFVLKGVPVGAQLEVSYIGFKPLVIASASAEIIQLTEDTQLLDEVVVVGYGTQKKVNLTGSVSVVSGEDLADRPVVSAASALQGADPSLNISFGTGSPASGYNVNIRGVMSVNGGNPLILVDGVETSLSQLNPNDIESVSILKDASSSAIYGAKASSGVVLVTTKKGGKGDKATITYSGRYGVSQNTTSTDFITTGYDHVNLVNKFYTVNKGREMFLYNEEEMKMLLDRRGDNTESPERPWVIVGEDGKYKYFANFDWYNYFFEKTRPQHEHNLSISGGNEKTSYYISGRFLQQQGFFKIYPDIYKNYSFRAKLDTQLTPWLKYSTNVNYNVNNYNYAGFRNEQQTIHNLYSNVSAAFVPFNPDGSIVQYTNQMSANSPLGAGHGGFLSANKARNSRGNKQLTISNQIDVKPFEDLVVTASHSYRNYIKENRHRNLPFEYSRSKGVLNSFRSGTIYNEYRELHYDGKQQSVNLFATYNKSLKDVHHITAVAGMQYDDFRSVENEMSQRDLLSDNLASFSVGTGEAKITQDIGTYATLGFFGRLNYDYKGKYLVELSGRYDGSSRFAPNHRWGFFPSASAGWRISEEQFWEPLRSFWDNAKLRISYGSLGNQQVSYYSYLDQIFADRIMDYTFDGKVKANYADITDPISTSLTWETVSTYNLGVDIDMLQNRLNMTADFFVRDTKDMLTPSLTLPSVFGAKTPKENAADLRTRGWELQVSWRDQVNLAGKPLSYNVGVTLGDYVTKITKFNNPEKLISDYYEGQTLGEIWGYRVSGLFATDEEASRYQSEIDDRAVNNRVYSSKLENKLMAGDVRFVDINGDKIISEGAGTGNNPGDKQIIGNSQPRYTYSLRLGADWNGFGISAFFQGVGKQDWFPTERAYDFWGPYSFPSLSFIHKDFLSNTWSEQNPSAYFPRPRGYVSYSAGALGEVNDRYLQDVSYLRLKNLTISYELPVLKNVFQQIRVYVTGENLFYWSALKRYSKTVDPELTNTTSTYNSGSGVGYAYSKSYSIGVSIVF